MAKRKSFAYLASCRFHDLCRSRVKGHYISPLLDGEDIQKKDEPSMVGGAGNSVNVDELHLAFGEEDMTTRAGCLGNRRR